MEGNCQILRSYATLKCCVGEIRKRERERLQHAPFKLISHSESRQCTKSIMMVVRAFRGSCWTFVYLVCIYKMSLALFHLHIYPKHWTFLASFCLQVPSSVSIISMFLEVVAKDTFRFNHCKDAEICIVSRKYIDNSHVRCTPGGGGGGGLAYTCISSTGMYRIISWVMFNHARPTYETIRNNKSNHALESSHGETAMTG